MLASSLQHWSKKAVSLLMISPPGPAWRGDLAEEPAKILCKKIKISRRTDTDPVSSVLRHYCWGCVFLPSPGEGEAVTSSLWPDLFVSCFPPLFFSHGDLELLRRDLLMFHSRLWIFGTAPQREYKPQSVIRRWSVSPVAP